MYRSHPAANGQAAVTGWTTACQIVGCVTGLREPPYLVRRCDGQVVQLARLLYEIASRMNGRELAAIAADVGARLDLRIHLRAGRVRGRARVRPTGQEQHRVVIPAVSRSGRHVWALLAVAAPTRMHCRMRSGRSSDASRSPPARPSSPLVCAHLQTHSSSRLTGCDTRRRRGMEYEMKT